MNHGHFPADHSKLTVQQLLEHFDLYFAICDVIEYQHVEVLRNQFTHPDVLVQEDE